MGKQIVGHFTEFVGRRIANRQKTKKMTDEDLARKTGVSVHVLENMKRGYDHINLEQLMLFARYLGTTSDLLGLPHYGDDDMKAFIDERVKQMTAEELQEWQASTGTDNVERYRLFILDFDSEDPAGA